MTAMGRPRHLPPARKPGTSPSRREFFKRSGSAAVALAATAPLLPLAAGAAAKYEFQHGVASGDPLADRVILWTRITPLAPKDRVQVDYLVARDPGLTDVVQTGSVHTGPTRDFTVKIDVQGLQPGST